ncbi:threonine/serine exporter family protein [Faecalibacterium taiwanense]
MVCLRAGRNAGGRQCRSLPAGGDPLTLLTRVFAIVIKMPVTVFLLSGIFPLVPGAGIYYCAYYFIQGNNALALSNGISTFKVAVALAIGITLVLCVPLPKRK